MIQTNFLYGLVETNLSQILGFGQQESLFILWAILGGKTMNKVLNQIIQINFSINIILKLNRFTAVIKTFIGSKSNFSELILYHYKNLYQYLELHQKYCIKTTWLQIYQLLRSYRINKLSQLIVQFFKSR